MKQSELAAFITRIVQTSPDDNSATMAIKQLRQILSSQVSENELAILDAARDGVTEDIATMKSQPITDLSQARALAERARIRRKQIEEELRNGRC